jgi:hypothetical protein
MDKSLENDYDDRHSFYNQHVDLSASKYLEPSVVYHVLKIIFDKEYYLFIY